MSDYEDDDETQTIIVAPPRVERFLLVDLIGIGLTTAANCSAAIGAGLASVAQDLFAHGRLIRLEEQAAEFEAAQQAEIEALEKMAGLRESLGSDDG